ncbi:hypothetical protein BDV10DRAFT_171121 [Aspergillus recurvatus]
MSNGIPPMPIQWPCLEAGSGGPELPAIDRVGVSFILAIAFLSFFANIKSNPPDRAVGFPVNDSYAVFVRITGISRACLYQRLLRPSHHNTPTRL